MKLIKNGIILTAETEFEGDILVDGEVIRAVGRGLDGLADDVIDASGKYIFPGGVDEHTHFGSFGGRLFKPQRRRQWEVRRQLSISRLRTKAIL